MFEFRSHYPVDDLIDKPISQKVLNKLNNKMYNGCDKYNPFSTLGLEISKPL